MENQKNPVKLEEAMERIEQVIAAMEQERIDLDEALKLYEEGIGLTRICQKQLEEAQRKVEILQMTSDGEIRRENFSEN